MPTTAGAWNRPLGSPSGAPCFGGLGEIRLVLGSLLLTSEVLHVEGRGPQLWRICAGQLHGAGRAADRPCPGHGQPHGGSHAHSAWQGNTGGRASQKREHLSREPNSPWTTRSPEGCRDSCLELRLAAGGAERKQSAVGDGVGGWLFLREGAGPGDGRRASTDRGVAGSGPQLLWQEGIGVPALCRLTSVTLALLSGPQPPRGTHTARRRGSLPFTDSGVETGGYRRAVAGSKFKAGSTPSTMISASNMPLSPAPWGRLAQHVTPGRWSPRHGGCWASRASGG